MFIVIAGQISSYDNWKLSKLWFSERTKDGIEAARTQNRKPGRPPLEAETVLALQNLVQAGMTAGQAAKQLGKARSTVYRLIKETTQT